MQNVRKLQNLVRNLHVSEEFKSAGKRRTKNRSTQNEFTPQATRRMKQANLAENFRRTKEKNRRKRPQREQRCHDVFGVLGRDLGGGSAEKLIAVGVFLSAKNKKCGGKKKQISLKKKKRGGKKEEGDGEKGGGCKKEEKSRPRVKKHDK